MIMQPTWSKGWEIWLQVAMFSCLLEAGDVRWIKSLSYVYVGKFLGFEIAISFQMLSQKVCFLLINIEFVLKYDTYSAPRGRGHCTTSLSCFIHSPGFRADNSNLLPAKTSCYTANISGLIIFLSCRKTWRITPAPGNKIWGRTVFFDRL